MASDRHPAKHAALFNFRQRAGRFDWRQISSIDVEDVVVRWKVSELQSVLDHVTFSEFLPADVKTNTIEAVTKLVHVMQLIIEYLLNHQEVQLKQIQTLIKKVNRAKQQRDKAGRENFTLTEEIQSYQRQLHVLRKSLMTAGVPIPEPKPSAKVINPNAEEKEQSSEKMLYALMQHEQSSREQMMRMLEDQRQSFAREITSLVGTIKDLKAGDSSASSSDSSAQMLLMFESLKKQFEGQCGQLLQTVQVSRPVPSSSGTLSVLRDSAREVEMENLMRQQAALEVYERELQQRETALEQREREQSRRLAAPPTPTALPSALFAAVSASQGSQGSTQNSAARMLNAFLRHGMRRRLSRLFHRWAHQTQVLVAADLKHQARSLVQQSALPSQRELDLSARLVTQTQRASNAEAQHAILVRELQATQDRLKALTLSHGIRARQEQDWAGQLAAEKERSATLAAKHTALVQQAERDKAELLAQLASARRGADMSSSASFSTRRALLMDTSVMTSLELPSLARAAKEVNTSLQMDSGAEGGARLAMDLDLDRRFLELDEAALLQAALGRIEARNALPMSTQKAAMVTLAEELSMKLGSAL